MANFTLPRHSIDSRKMVRSWAYLEGIDAPSLPDVTPRLLIGQEHYHLTTPHEIVEGPPNAPVSTRTKLGWLIHRNVDQCRHEEVDVTYTTWTADDTLHELVKRSFTTEDFGVKLAPPVNSKSDERALKILAESTYDGRRWQNGLLWRHDDPCLPESREKAMKRLCQLERRRLKDEGLAQQHSQKIASYLVQGYARKLNPVEASVETTKTWYISHFVVVNPAKKKLRLVFDAAAKSRGTSLNDHLLPGPDTLTPLTAVLMNFRLHEFAFGGDFRKMFHQVGVKESDQSAQRFLWRNLDITWPPEVYVMKVMTFGAVSSLTTAQYIKNRNAKEHGAEHPEAVRAIVDKHYVDDYFDCTPTEDAAVQRTAEVIAIHQQVDSRFGTGSPTQRRFLRTFRPIFARGKSWTRTLGCAD